MAIAPIQALDAGCAGEEPLDLRDRAIVSILKTTAARNSSVRLLRFGDIDFERAVLRFRRAKGGKALDVTLQPGTQAALPANFERGRPLLVEQALAPPVRRTLAGSSSPPIRATGCSRSR